MTAGPGSPFETAIADWLAGYSSERTRAEYGREATRWNTWCVESMVDPMTARRPDLDRYARACESGGDRPSTVARRLAALSSLYRHAVGSADSPARVLRRP